MNGIEEIPQSRPAKQMALMMTSEGDADRIKLILGRGLAKSIFDNKADDTLYWAIVHARICSERLSPRIRADLFALLGEG